MAKSLIRNIIAGKNYGFIVPADGQTAATFAGTALDGTYQVFERQSESGNAKVDGVVTIKAFMMHRTFKGEGKKDNMHINI